MIYKQLPSLQREYRCDRMQILFKSNIFTRAECKHGLNTKAVQKNLTFDQRKVHTFECNNKKTRKHLLWQSRGKIVLNETAVSSSLLV